MLILPLTGKINKKKPPLMTIGLILINALVFFLFQVGDGEKYRLAVEYYFDSGLAEIEIPYYVEYVEIQTGETIAYSQGAQMYGERLLELQHRINNDTEFLDKLRRNEIISRDDPVYSNWKPLRRNYEEKMSRVVSMSYGFIPANGNLTTAFTYMFLHGGFLHLLGNMVFLWLVGCVLELGCGRIFYSASYLVTGMLSVGLFWLIYKTSGTPLVGASGAISGLIGLYTVLFGKQRIKVFISLGFYFNYLKAPAIVLLPIWIANEFIQLFFGGASNVAYVAHIGGLGAGALLGFLNLKYLGQVDKEIFEQDAKEEIPSLMETALQHIAKLDMDGARPYLDRILEIDPMHREALRHLFNVDKLRPQSEQFHKTASRLLRFWIHTKDDPEALLATYKEYCQHAKSLRLSPELWFSIASALSSDGHPQDAERIMGMLIRKHPGFQKVPTGILSLARGYLKMGMSEKAKKCLRLICQKYPQSAETHAARKLLGETT